MEIDVPLKEVGTIDIDDLRDAVLSLDESAWAANNYRQEEYREHRDTKSLVMIFTTAEGWPNIEITKESGWDLLSHVAGPIMDKILGQHYPKGGTVVRAVIANLPAGCVIPTHIDSHPSFHVGHRIHVPLTTNPRVRFMIEGKIHQLQVGKIYELNNQLNHSVMNKGNEDRFTFIFDYIPPDGEFTPTFVN